MQKILEKVVLCSIASAFVVTIAILLLFAFADMKRTIELENELETMQHHFKVVDCAGAMSFKNLMDQPTAKRTTFDENMILCEGIVSERESFKNKVKEFWENVKKSAKYLFS